MIPFIITGFKLSLEEANAWGKALHPADDPHPLVLYGHLKYKLGQDKELPGVSTRAIGYPDPGGDDDSVIVMIITRREHCAKRTESYQEDLPEPVEGPLEAKVREKIAKAGFPNAPLITAYAVYSAKEI